MDLANYDKKYLDTYREINTDQENLHRFTENFFAKPGYGRLTHMFQYKDRYKLYYSCPEAIPTEQFLTSEIL